MKLSEQEFLAETIEEIKKIDFDGLNYNTVYKIFRLNPSKIVSIRRRCSFCGRKKSAGMCYGTNNPALTICTDCTGKNINYWMTHSNIRGNCFVCLAKNINTDGIGIKTDQGTTVSRHICHNCGKTELSAREIRGEIYKIEEKLDLRLKHIKETKKKEIEARIVPENNIVKSYVDAGLAETFAIAIVKNEESESEILDLWEADWWKQYPADDVLVCAVLDGKITEAEGKWLNSIRSDHMRLALAAVEGQVSIEWSRALLDAGFINYPEAVNDVLNGGKPSLIARIRKLDVDQKVLPIQLENKVSDTFSNTEDKN